MGLLSVCFTKEKETPYMETMLFGFSWNFCRAPSQDIWTLNKSRYLEAQMNYLAKF